MGYLQALVKKHEYSSIRRLYLESALSNHKEHMFHLHAQAEHVVKKHGFALNILNKVLGLFNIFIKD